jgi:hypothetical protein
MRSNGRGLEHEARRLAATAANARVVLLRRPGVRQRYLDAADQQRQVHALRAHLGHLHGQAGQRIERFDVPRGRVGIAKLEGEFGENMDGRLARGRCIADRKTQHWLVMKKPRTSTPWTTMFAKARFPRKLWKATPISPSTLRTPPKMTPRKTLAVVARVGHEVERKGCSGPK